VRIVGGGSETSSTRVDDLEPTATSAVRDAATATGSKPFGFEPAGTVSQLRPSNDRQTIRQIRAHADGKCRRFGGSVSGERLELIARRVALLCVDSGVRATGCLREKHRPGELRREARDEGQEDQAEDQDHNYRRECLDR
jgi:hypothetical protein